jgi:hypothetical protein
VVQAKPLRCDGCGLIKDFYYLFQGPDKTIRLCRRCQREIVKTVVQRGFLGVRRLRPFCDHCAGQGWVPQGRFAIRCGCFPGDEEIG